MKPNTIKAHQVLVRLEEALGQLDYNRSNKLVHISWRKVNWDQAAEHLRDKFTDLHSKYIDLQNETIITKNQQNGYRN